MNRLESILAPVREIAMPRSGMPRLQVVASVIVCVTLLHNATAQIPCGGYEVAHIIQAPPCPFVGPPVTYAFGMSPNGRWVVGAYAHCADSNYEAYVFDTAATQFLTLPRPVGTSGAMASGINDAGWVCGTYQTSANGLRGFVRNLITGETIELPAASGALGWSQALSINASGVVCGWRSIDDGGNPITPQTAFKWSQETSFQDLGLINGSTTQAKVINELGAVIGSMFVAGQDHAFLWEGTNVTDLGTLAGLHTAGNGVNNLNEVVGGSLISSGPDSTSHAFLWSDGAMIDLGTLPGDLGSTAGDINDAGLVVGRSRQSPKVDFGRAFVWYEGTMHDLHDLVWRLPSPLVLDSAGVIQPDGTIVARTIDYSTGDVAAVILKPLPTAFGDANEDCAVNVVDLLLVISEWGSTDSPADVNHDRIVNQLDLMVVIDHWTFN